MSTEILLPQWGMEMQDGTIVKWLKKEGDAIEEGEPLLEVETAKIEAEMESIATGVVAHILVPEGATVPIRTLLAIITAPGEEVPRPAGEPTSPAVEPASPPPAYAPTQPRGEVTVQVVPASRRLAQQRGIDLSRVQGSGPKGRILIEDVEKAIQAGTGPAERVVPITGMRQTIANRMRDSLHSMAQVTLTTEADVTDAVRFGGRAGPPVDGWGTQPSAFGN